MALTAEEYTEMATLAADVGDEQAELEALEALEGLESVGGLGQQPTFAEGVVGRGEALRTVAEGLGRTIAGGVAGTLQAINPFAEEGAGAETVRSFQEGAFQPQTEAGKAELQVLNELVQKGADIINFPISGLAGLLELVSGQGIDQAVKTINSIQAGGAVKTAGERTFEETGSPLAATAVETGLTALELGIGGGAARSAVRGAERGGAAVGRAVEAVTPPVTAAVAPVAQAGKEIVAGVRGFQSPAKREIAKLIEEGSSFRELAKFELVETPRAVGEPSRIEQFFDTKGPKIKVDTKAGEAIKQGFSEGVIQPLKRASRPDKALMRKMTNIAERAKKDELFGLENRPGDVAGDLLMDRLDVITQANKRAGKTIGNFSKKLVGKPIESKVIGQAFVEDLAEMGIKVTDDLKLDFRGSVIESLAGPEKAISDIFTRMTSGKPDAKKLHDLKLFIDEQITFGKNATGLAGKAERALKDLRFNINRTLGDSFPEYKAANKTYAETITALDAFQDVAGKKMDLLGENADKATGTLMRRLMSNAQSRITLLDSLKGIDDAVQKHGGFGGPLRIEGKGGAKNNLKMLVLYADELDKVFGAAPRTSLQGQFDQALGTAARAVASKGGAVDVVLGVAGKAAEKARGINEENAFKAIKKLLGEK